MTAVQIGNEWFVVGPLIGPFNSNAEAWKWLDQHMKEPRPGVILPSPSGSPRKEQA